MGSLLCSDLKEELVERGQRQLLIRWQVQEVSKDSAFLISAECKIPVHAEHRRFFTEGCGIDECLNASWFEREDFDFKSLSTSAESPTLPWSDNLQFACDAGSIPRGPSNQMTR